MLNFFKVLTAKQQQITKSYITTEINSEDYETLKGHIESVRKQISACMLANTKKTTKSISKQIWKTKRHSGFLTFSKFDLAACKKLEDLPRVDELIRTCLAESLESVSNDLFISLISKLSKYPNFANRLQKHWKTSHSLQTIDSALVGVETLIQIYSKVDRLLPNSEFLYKSRRKAKEWRSTVYTLVGQVLPYLASSS
jgi:hypothetical protein